jgi:hypothetical protein
MHMKPMLALAAIAGLLMTPAAYAQVTCSELNRINSEANDDFDGIAGDELDEDIYQATYTLSGSSGCTIDYTWDSIYSCEYQFAEFSAASNARNSFAATIIGCLPGWQVQSVPPDASAVDGYRTMMGTRYAGVGVDADLEWVSVLEEHTDTNGTHYHVWVELAYYW